MLIQPHVPIPICTPAANHSTLEQPSHLNGRRRWAYGNDIPGSRCGPEDGPWPRSYELLSEEEIWHELRVLGRPQSRVFQNEDWIGNERVTGKGKSRGWSRADMVNFQPSLTVRTQDRYVVRELKVGDTRWSFTGVFDGHLGETTVEHVAYHLPLLIEQNLRQLLASQPQLLSSPASISHLLSQSIKSLDDSITDSILSLFGAKNGDLSALDKLSDKQIWEIVNDQHLGGENWRKVRVGMYGCTAVVALVRLDTDGTEDVASGSNVWIGNLGDCQAILATPVGEDDWDVQVLTTEHNGYNDDEIARVRREHPGEPESVVDGRVLGALAPFRCIGDTPFKQPPEFTRRILYSLLPRSSNTNGHTSPWEAFLVRNKTPPYISNDPEVIHVSLTDHPSGKTVDKTRPRFLILASDGFTDICKNKKDVIDSTAEMDTILKEWARGMVLDMQPNNPNTTTSQSPSNGIDIPRNISPAASLPLSTSPPVATPFSPLGSFGSFGSPPPISALNSQPSSLPSRNMALRLLRRALGTSSNPGGIDEEERESVSKVLTLKDIDTSWIDDVSIVVQTL